MESRDNGLWRLRRLCQQTIQKFWFQEMELKDVLRVYGIDKDDECHDSIVKFLLKTKRDFINGFSFFTRESVDDKILRLMEKHHHPCMRG